IRSLRPLRTTAPAWIRARDAHAHRGAALEPDQDDLFPLADVHGDGVGNRSRETTAMAAVGRRLVLLANRPKTVESCESQLRARHLLDPPATGAQDLDHRRVHPRAACATVDLGVLAHQ